jgi:hypothetical protein
MGEYKMENDSTLNNIQIKISIIFKEDQFIRLSFEVELVERHWFLVLG